MNLQESIRKILREETEDGMKNILFDMFDEHAKGADFYEYYDSLWMIIPETKEWVFYISKSGNLRYNYNFFKQSYKYVSLEVVENQHFITEWVEDVLKTGVRHTSSEAMRIPQVVEDVLKTGVRHTYVGWYIRRVEVEDILKTGEKIE